MTPTMKRMLDDAKRYSAEHGVFPSYRELMTMGGHRNISSVHRVMQDLIARGSIERLGDKPMARGFRIAGSCPHCGK